MTDILAIGLHGMQQDMARLERIAMNLANATTPGYKREVASALPLSESSFENAMDAASPASESSGPTGSAGFLLIQTDFKPGTPRSTGASLDVALSGPGFFEVITDAGPAYTRQGNWKLDGRGRLVTAQGNPVMGLGGEIVLTHPNPRIDAKGQVFDASVDGRSDPVPVGQLKVVQFPDPQSLQQLGAGLFGTSQSPDQVSDADLDVHQGYLESANVSSMQEMSQLIRSMRHFESMQKLASGYDEMLGAAVRKLGESV